MKYLFLILALLLNTSANILMKISANKINTIEISHPKDVIIAIIKLPTLIIAVILFALNILFYILALTKINISIAYPIMTSVGFLIISIFSTFYLKESLTLLQIIGIILIAIGITLIAYHLK